MAHVFGPVLEEVLEAMAELPDGRDTLQPAYGAGLPAAGRDHWAEFTIKLAIDVRPVSRSKFAEAKAAECRSGGGPRRNSGKVDVSTGLGKIVRATDCRFGPGAGLWGCP